MYLTVVSFFTLIALSSCAAPPDVVACIQTVKAGDQNCVNQFNAQSKSPGKETEDQLQRRACCSYWRFRACTLALFPANPTCHQKVLAYLDGQEKAQGLAAQCAKYPAIENPVCKGF